MVNKAQRRLEKQRRKAETHRAAHDAFEELGRKGPELNSHDVLPSAALPSTVDSVRKEVKLHGLLFSLRADTAADRLTDASVRREIINDHSYTYEEVKKAIWDGVSEWPHRGGVER